MPRLASPPEDIPRPKPRSDIQELITGDGPLIPVILRLAGPVVLMMYLQGAYNIIDSIWVGQLLGKTSLAAIATGGFVNMLARHSRQFDIVDPNLTLDGLRYAYLKLSTEKK